ncbi:uncharacterized protein LOC141626422 isoform X2 [Silene latifolia]|uniref:uncharacterized protein LOC141626422 isoform X2 n=1 Tax=Silene latifolia TaxID=37657 RepID=UPI003D787A7F
MAADGGLPTLARVKLVDLVVKEGLPSDSYKLSVSTLCHSLSQYSAAILQFPDGDGALLRSALQSACLYFHHRPSYPDQHLIHTNDDSQEWCRTSGYHSDPQLCQETYDYRPGLTPTDPGTGIHLSPAGLVDIFPLLGKASRDILDAISFNWSLCSSPFTEILDNVPLRPTEISSSVLSVCCHGAQHHNLTPQEDIFSHQQHPSDKSLISIVKSDKPGLHIRDFQGHWVLVDADLGPQEAVMYPGLALYQATAGRINPALHRIEITNPHSNLYGRCSLTFKLMPKSMTRLNSSEMRAADHGVDAQFQLPVPVDDFMQRAHPASSLLNQQGLPSFNFPTPQDDSMVAGSSSSVSKLTSASNYSEIGGLLPRPPLPRPSPLLAVVLFRATVDLAVAGMVSSVLAADLGDIFFFAIYFRLKVFVSWRTSLEYFGFVDI